MKSDLIKQDPHFYADQSELTPKQFVEVDIAKKHSEEYMFMACIDHINSVSSSSVILYIIKLARGHSLAPLHILWAHICLMCGTDITLHGLIRNYYQ